MTLPPAPDRCRIMLLYDIRRALAAGSFADMLKAGDIAGVILYDSYQTGDEAAFQKAAQKLVPVIQEAQACAIIAADSRIAGRVKADGLHLEGNWQELRDAVEKYHPAMSVGYGNPRDRHSALEAGEMQPDYILFGKPGMDKKPQPHPRNLALGAWWAAMTEIPCLVQAGSDAQSAVAAAACGAEFVALEEAVFAAGDMARAISRINGLLDEHAARPGDENR